MDFAHLTGLRQGDILKLKLDDLLDSGIYIHINKTRNKLLIEWTEELTKIVTLAKTRAEISRSDYLFPNNAGKKYSSSGFQTLWQRLIKKL